MSIHERLREYLGDRDIRQKELAAALDIPKTTLSGYMTGKRQFPHEMVKKIAETLEITTDYLYGLTEDPKPPIALSRAERGLMETYRALSREQRELVLQTIRLMGEQNTRREG